MSYNSLESPELFTRIVIALYFLLDVIHNDIIVNDFIYFILIFKTNEELISVFLCLFIMFNDSLDDLSPMSLPILLKML